MLGLVGGEAWRGGDVVALDAGWHIVDGDRAPDDVQILPRN